MLAVEQVPGPNMAIDETPKQRQSRTFFVRGLKTLLPTLITLYLIVWAWNFLWDQLGRHLVWAVQNVQYQIEGESAQWGKIKRQWMKPSDSVDSVRSESDSASLEWKWWAQLVGVSLAVLLVYSVGLLVGNLIGRTFLLLGESLVMRLPIVRAIYPAVKQITDFVLAERGATFNQSRVVACKPHANDIWSIGLVTGQGLPPLTEATGQEMVTVFIPSSPTAFSGYVVVVPRAQVIELPLKVEEAMRMLVSGGVLTAVAEIEQKSV